MTTQFSLFIFTVPPAIEYAFKHPAQNYPLVLYAVFSIVIESFLMCNFLIAIVLDAFIEAQAEYKKCDVELTIFEDVAIVLKIKVREIAEWWPSKRRLIFVLTNEIATNNVAWWQLIPLGVSAGKARGIWQTYYGSVHENTDEPRDKHGWQSQLRPPPPSHTTQWSIACEMALDLGFSGIPSADVWVKMEGEITKKLAQLVDQSTSESRTRLARVELQNASIASMLENVQLHLGIKQPSDDGTPYLKATATSNMGPRESTNSGGGRGPVQRQAVHSMHTAPQNVAELSLTAGVAHASELAQTIRAGRAMENQTAHMSPYAHLSGDQRAQSKSNVTSPDPVFSVASELTFADSHKGASIRNTHTKSVLVHRDTVLMPQGSTHANIMGVLDAAPPIPQRRLASMEMSQKP